MRIRGLDALSMEKVIECIENLIKSDVYVRGQIQDVMAVGFTLLQMLTDCANRVHHAEKVNVLKSVLEISW